jgi:DNA-directed RNA polymerase subunit M/transcription elongation factor TFIIS
MLSREDKEARKLVYYCKNCQHVEEADNSSYCVYVSETTTYSSKDKTMVSVPICDDTYMMVYI